MSRAIQVRVSESVVRTIHVEDGVESPLELLPVLAPDRMAELLAKELEGLGFARDGKLAKRTDGDVDIVIDLEAAMVSVKIGAQSMLEEEIQLETRTAIEQQQQTEARLRGAAIDQLEARLTARTEAMRREITDKLEQKLAELRTELDQAIGRATVEALTERAQQLGTIEEIAKDEAGNVTIRVKL